MIQDTNYFYVNYRTPDGDVHDLFNNPQFQDIPECPGAYLLLSQEKKFQYPCGKSQVIYIGKSGNLRKRIKKHFDIISDLKSYSKEDDGLANWYYKRYDYINKYGCRVVWFNSCEKYDQVSLHMKLSTIFYKTFQSLPVGNEESPLPMAT